MIGDPSGRSSERNLLDVDTLEANVAAIRGQLERFLDFSPGSGAVLVNNLDWLGRSSLIDFLRDTGKHFTIPYMLAKDSVQVRLERGLSFTEFSYMLLQSYDFAHLHRTLGVELQMGGADQWGNITAGLELIRRTNGRRRGGAGGNAEAASRPTVSPTSCCCRHRAPSSARARTGDSVWLDPARTSPYAFYQHWVNTDDRDVGTYLRWFTELPARRDRGARGGDGGSPESRAAQRALALDVTARTHGAEARRHARSPIPEALFSAARDRRPGDLASLYDSSGGFIFDPVARPGHGGPAGRGRPGRLDGRGAPVDRGRRRDRQWHAVTDPALVPELVAGEWLDVRIGKRRREIGRRRRS